MIPIFGSPQKSSYGSPDEFPDFSGQTHWASPGVNATPGIPSHVHVEMKFPIYGVTTTEPFTVPFKIVLFNTAGKVTSISSISGRLKSWTLDNGATLPLVGNPNGLVAWTGTVTFEPLNAPPRGWMMYELRVGTTFTNGDKSTTSLRLPRYSLIDPSAPETGSGNVVNTQGRVGAAGDTLIERWGSQFTEFKQILPVLGPVSPEKPWPVLASLYNYAPPAGAFPNGGIAELRLDPDLHNGNPGTLLKSVAGPNNSPSETGLLYSLPVGIANGVHKVMTMWRRPTAAGDRDFVTNFVYTITVGPGGVAPPSGTPVTPPPPPPPPTSPCVTDPLIVPPSSAFGWPADPAVTGVTITQIGRNCPPIKVNR